MLSKALILTVCSVFAGNVGACDEHAMHHASATISAISPSAVVAVSGDSLFQLKTPLTNQLEQAFFLGNTPEKLTLVTMFYGDCNVSCPIVLENIKRTLEAANTPQLQAVMVSLNPGVDTPAVLAKLAVMHELKIDNAILAVSDNDAHTRQLAAALGVKYRRGANGEINHNTRFVLLDRLGQIVASSDTLNTTPDPAILREIQRQLAKK